jgi:hypothetical protein
MVINKANIIVAITRRQIDRIIEILKLIANSSQVDIWIIFTIFAPKLDREL